MSLCLAGSEKALRNEAVSVGIDLLGTFYRWNGKEPSGGLDCSGFVTWCLSSVGAIPAVLAESPTLSSPTKRAAYFRGWWNADRLFKELPATTEPQPGDVACYGTPKRCTHVMLVTANGVLGASGGDSSTTSRAVAKKQGAEVKAYPSHLYRKDFIGFRRSPFPRGT